MSKVFYNIPYIRTGDRYVPVTSEEARRRNARADEAKEIAEAASAAAEAGQEYTIPGETQADIDETSMASGEQLSVEDRASYYWNAAENERPRYTGGSGQDDPGAVMESIGAYIEEQTQLAGLGNGDVFSAMAALQLLNGENARMSDLFSEEPEAEVRRFTAGEALMDRILSLQAARPQEIGRLGRDLLPGILNFTLPDIDLADPGQASRFADVLNTIRTACAGYSQMFGNYWQNPVFRSGYLNQGETWERFENEVRPAVDLGEALAGISAVDAEDPVQRITSRYMQQQYGQILKGGRTLAELNDVIDGTELLKQTRALESAVREGMASEQHREALQRYANGRGRFPAELLEGLETGSAVRMPETLRQVTFPRDNAERLFRPENWFDPALAGDVGEAFHAMFDGPDWERTLRLAGRAGYPAGNPSQLFFIGDKSVDQYLRDNDLSVTNENRMAAIVQATAMARERVSMVGFRMEDGAVKPVVTDIQADLQAFKGMEGVFQKSRPRRAEQLYADETGTPERHEQILKSVEDAMMAGKQREFREEAASYTWSNNAAMERQVGIVPSDLEKNGRLRKAPSAVNSTVDRHSEQYEAAKEQTQKLYKTLVDSADGRNLGLSDQQLHADLFNNQMAGLRALAALKLMQQEPDLHLADLMSPSFDVRQKMKAASFEVLEELPGLKREERAEYVMNGMKQLAGISLKEETLRALGADPAAGPEEASAILNSSKYQKQASAFMQGYAEFFNAAQKALEAPYMEEKTMNHLNVDILGADRDFHNAFYDNTCAMLDLVDQTAKSVNAEYDNPRWSMQRPSNPAGVSMPEPPLSPKAEFIARSLSMSYMNGLVCKYGNLADVTPEDRKLFQDMQTSIRGIAQEISGRVSEDQFKEMLTGGEMPEAVRDAQRRYADFAMNLSEKLPGAQRTKVGTSILEEPAQSKEHHERKHGAPQAQDTKTRTAAK